MISIIIPAYNAADYIDECLDSIEKQSYKEIEIIIVDDGSTDATLERIKRHSETSELNYKVISQKNSGQSVARNKGIREATGEYIVFVDSDDWLPRKDVLEKMSSEIKNGKYDYVQTGMSFHKDNRITKCYIPNKENFLIGSDILSAAIKCEGLFTGPFAKIYRTSFLKSYSLLFIEGLVNEDTAHSIEIAAYAKKVGFINEDLYNIRERDGSTSRADFKRMIGSMHAVLKITERNLIEMKKLHCVKEIFYARYLRSLLYNLLQSSQRSKYEDFISDWKYCMEVTDYKKYYSFSKYLPLPHRIMYALSKYPKLFFKSFKILNKLGIKMH